MTEPAGAAGVTVSDNERRGVYEAVLDGALAGVLEYRLVTAGHMVLVSTRVEPAFEGRGVGSALARFALEDARRRRLRVVPRCPFVATYLKRHPEYADLVSDPAEAPCGHLDQIRAVKPSGDGCLDCLRIGGEWVHLRLCLTCGGVRCCDSSPNRHASAHAREARHPLVQSFEPGEDWIWCYVDEVLLESE